MKVLVADFDGTFFTDEFENDIERVNKFVDNGNIFIIATGRSLESLHEKIKNYNIKYSYLICSDGAVIYDKNLVKIYHIDLDKELALKIVEQLNNDKNIREVFVSNGCKLLENSEQINSILGRHIKKRLAFNSLKKITSNFSNVHGYISTNWVVINDLKASKGNAIKYLIDKHNFDQKKVFTVGNELNDISMNELYCGYAMKKANRHLKRISVGKVKSISNLIEIIEQKY